MMRKLISFIIAVLFFSACGHNADGNAGAQEPINDGHSDSIPIAVEPIKMLMTHSGSMQPSEDLELYGCDFTVVINDSGDTTHWSTRDLNFKTPEGYTIGTAWSDLPIELQNSLDKMLGWGYSVKLNSDWQLGFCEGSSCTDNVPTAGSSVEWIFKRSE